MNEETALPPAFAAHVLAWLQTVRPTAASVERVNGYGTDWAGGTEEGFHDEFGVSIMFTHADGTHGSIHVAGEQMESLWTHVVGGFKEGT